MSAMGLKEELPLIPKPLPKIKPIKPVLHESKPKQKGVSRIV
jgi:hypothetical protein